MLISIQAEIERINFVNLPAGRPMKFEAVVRVGNAVVGKISDTRCWCNWGVITKGALVPGEWGGRVPEVVQCLRKLGMISREAMVAHIAQAKAADERKDRECDRKELDRLCKKYGISIQIPTALR